MQIVNNQALLVTTSTPHHIIDVVPKSKLIGKDEVLVKWGHGEASALAKLGFKNVPSPMERDYQWTGRHVPFEHQKVTSAFLSVNDRAFCFSQAGTAKTASVIWAADYLMKLGKIRRVLVICPLSIMKSAWQAELFTCAMHRSCVVAHGTPKQRAAAIASGAEFVIINYDGVGIVEKEIAEGGFDLVVIDEGTALKSVTTDRWKIINRICSKIARLWLLTGTPAAQSPLDAFGLARLVNPEGVPRYFGMFRMQVMYKVSRFKWEPLPSATETVHRVLQPAIRYEKKDCLDLPAVLHTEREAPLTPMQERYYREMKKKMTMEAAGERITSVNAAVALGKLLQIACGTCITDTGEAIEFDVSNRINVVVETIEETSNKVLIFVPYTHAIERLEETLTRKGISCAVINGAVSVNRRNDIEQAFQNQVEPKVLILQPQAASHGLTLTAADTIIWYAPVTSVETYLQANARIDRPGQKNIMTVVHIKGSEVEERLYKMLRSNIVNHEGLIDLYREEIK